MARGGALLFAALIALSQAAPQLPLQGVASEQADALGSLSSSSAADSASLAGAPSDIGVNGGASPNTQIPESTVGVGARPEANPIAGNSGSVAGSDTRPEVPSSTGTSGATSNSGSSPQDTTANAGAVSSPGTSSSVGTSENGVSPGSNPLTTSSAGTSGNTASTNSHSDSSSIPGTAAGSISSPGTPSSADTSGNSINTGSQSRPSNTAASGNTASPGISANTGTNVNAPGSGASSYNPGFPFDSGSSVGSQPIFTVIPGFNNMLPPFGFASSADNSPISAVISILPTVINSERDRFGKAVQQLIHNNVDAIADSINAVAQTSGKFLSNGVRLIGAWPTFFGNLLG